MATASEAAKHIDLGVRRFIGLVDAGVFERRARGDYALDDVRIAYVRHLREAAAGRTSGEGNAELIVELTKLRAAQAAAQEFKNSILNGQYVRIDAVGAAVDSEYATIRERLLTIPGKLADALVGRNRAAIDDVLRREVNEALNELSEPAAMAEAVTAPVVTPPSPKASPSRSRKTRRPPHARKVKK